MPCQCGERRRAYNITYHALNIGSDGYCERASQPGVRRGTAVA